MEITIIKANCDLGTHVDGSSFGPDKLVEYANPNADVMVINQLNIQKSKDPKDMRKNEKEINIFNTELYEVVNGVFKNEKFPLTVGGDHSIAIATALAAVKNYKKIGIIWIDSHSDYNTFETTITGNIHGLPLATITGYHNEELRSFHQGNLIDPKNAVIIGARSIDPKEVLNLKEAGITVFTTKDILQQGIDKIVRCAIEIAGNNTFGIHVSYDLDVIDPVVAPGVSIKAKQGIDEKTAYDIIDALYPYQKQITSFDLVEFNPLEDKEDKTLKIAKNILEKFMINEKKLDEI